MAPQGSTSYMSDNWRGRPGDKYVKIMLYFLKKFLPKNIVLAKRGFDIVNLVAMQGA